MPKGYNGETVILPDGLNAPGELVNKFFVFVFYDGKIEKYRLEGIKRLGRMTDVNVPDIAVQNMYLSRCHGYFTVENDSVTYTADETTNGIALNGAVIDPGTTVSLSDGDELVIHTGKSSENKGDIVLKCAFSPSKISLWDSMIKAQYDELTGLPGRRLFIDRYNTLTKNPETDDWLFILDVDKFKQINDVYGHSAGDETLRALADELKKPEYNIVISARWGGDEFVGVIRGSRENVTETVNRLVDYLSAKTIRSSFPVSVSLGLCRIPERSGGDQLSLILENADKALYRAKENDNERIRFFE